MRHLRPHTAHADIERLGNRPENLYEAIDDGDHESWIESPVPAGSRGIVLAIQPDTICCAGISTLLDAMALGKPVIMTECPATNGFVTGDDVTLVPPHDPNAFGRDARGARVRISG